MNLAHFRCVIFDMDGVVIDSESLQVEAEKHVCSKFHMVVPNHEWPTFKGKKNDDIFGHIIKHYGNPSMSLSDMSEMKRTYVKKHIQNAKLIPGILNLLLFLQTSRPKKQIALTTSTRYEIQEIVFKRFHLDVYFDKVVTGDQVENGKPDPEPYILTAQKLGVNTNDCVVIEDSVNGILSAKAAGCTVIGITTTFPREQLLLAGADYVVDSHNELKHLFQ